MERIVRYPDGTVKVFTDERLCRVKNTKKANLGIEFEKEINNACEYYLKNNIAVIYKKPTPIQVVKVDYPRRSKAKIVEAYYKTPSTTDYNGLYKEKYIDFEAKTCKENIFSFERIYPHQINHLNQISKLGGIAFLIIFFSSMEEIFILDSKYVHEKYIDSLHGGRKSLTYDFIRDNGIMIKYQKGSLDFLKYIDTYYKL